MSIIPVSDRDPRHTTSYPYAHCPKVREDVLYPGAWTNSVELDEWSQQCSVDLEDRKASAVFQAGTRSLNSLVTGNGKIKVYVRRNLGESRFGL